MDFRSDLAIRDDATPYPDAVADDPAPGSLGCHWDEAKGLVHVYGRGSWTMRQIDEHFAQLTLLLARQRERAGQVLVLVDLTNADVQPPEVIHRIRQATTQLYCDQDRVAVIVRTSLLKLQMRRAAEARNTEFFVSRNAALTWLTAYIEH